MAPQPVFQLRIRLEGVDPVVWRRLLVPGGVRMAKLHDMVQATMGWTNSHRYSFTVGDQIDGMQCDEYPEEELDEKEHTVLVVLRGGVRRFVYDDDCGDSWEHEVVVEDCTWSPLTLKHSVCLDGQNACPPADVGGVRGYAQFLDASADPDTRNTTVLSRGWGICSTRPPFRSAPSTRRCRRSAAGGGPTTSASERPADGPAGITAVEDLGISGEQAGPMGQRRGDGKGVGLGQCVAGLDRRRFEHASGKRSE